MQGRVTGGRRFRHRHAFLAAGLLLLVTQVTDSHAQANITPPAPVVLVLKLISETHVKPTTGVVLAPDGLVLVPASFVAAGDEIVVLDGGTDIVRHGRPAKTVFRHAGHGLALLSVDGLQRPGVVLAATAPAAGTQLAFSAFPPAEQLAAGEAPLRQQLSVVADELGLPMMAPAGKVPNVTGPMFNGCGQLAAFNLAQEPSGNDTGAAPLTLMTDSLASRLTDMLVPHQRAPCGVAIELPVKSGPRAEAETTPPSQLQVEATEGAAPGALPNAPATGNATTDPANPAPARSEVSTETGDSTPATTMTTATQPTRNGRLAYWWLAGVVALLLAGSRLWLRRRRRQRAAALHHLVPAEPDTTALGAARHDPAQATAGHPDDMDPEPAQPGEYLCFKGKLGDGRRFRRFIQQQQVDAGLVIGRGTAGLVLDHPAISRSHARLGRGELGLHLSDLGSSNGTFVRGLRCLPGETFWLEQDDEITLGDVSFKLNWHTTGANS